MVKNSNNSMVIMPANTESRWIAIGSKNEILSEGKTMVEVNDHAIKKSNSFILTFVPIKGETYIF